MTTPSRPIPRSPLARLALAAGLAAACFLTVRAAEGERPTRQAGEARRAPAREVAADQLRGLGYRFIGPPGNRVSAVVGVPGDPNTYYAGAASGGVWKSTDGGMHWEPVFERCSRPSRSAPSRSRRPTRTSSGPAPARRSSAATSRSATASTSRPTRARRWTHMGLETTGRIGRIVDRPAQPGRRLRVRRSGTATARSRSAASIGRRTAARPGSGCCSSTRTPACSDLAMDPNNPRILFAGTWPIDIKTWGRTSGGPGSGVFGRATAATTWKRLTGTACRTRRSARSPSASRVEPAPRLRPHRDGRARLALALGRRRRNVEGRQPQPPAERAAALLHAHARDARRRQRGLLPVERHERDLRRRRDDGVDSAGAATTTTCGPTRRTRAA